jgi:hypothetical protein
MLWDGPVLRLVMKKLNTSVPYLSHVLISLVVVTQKWSLTLSMKLVTLYRSISTVVLMLTTTGLMNLVLVSISLLHLMSGILNVSATVLLNMMLS